MMNRAMGNKMTEPQTPLGKRERLNRNILIFCGLIGLILGVGFAIASDHSVDGSGSVDLFTNEGPLPVGVAIAFAFIWAGIMPIVAWVWHRKAIDEQEAAAYRDGGYYAAYAYLILAPLWWMLWRGGLLPEPNGIAIFLGFNAIWLATWFWKKYR
jgi:hypothetical protein